MKLNISISILLLLSLCSTSFADSYIVKLKDNTLLQKKSLTHLGKFRKLRLKGLNYFVLDTKYSLKSLSYINEFEFIQKDTKLYHPAILDEDFSKSQIQDDLFKKQWALENTGWNSTRTIFIPGIKGEDIDAKKAWKLSSGSKEVIIALIDSGIDYKHPDLKDNIWINEVEKSGKYGVDDDGNGFIDDIYGYDFINDKSDPLDVDGHGSHCAGIIGASHNDIGIRGIMGSVRLMAAKFSTKGAGNMSSVLEALDYAIENGAHILSNSWGGAPKDSRPLIEILKKANDRGILVVAAAGNSGLDSDRFPIYPASYKLSNIISVGASGSRGDLPRFSNFGKNTVHIFAPGKKIYSTYYNRRYKYMSGTSMATPMISAIAGLGLSLNPNLKPEQIIQKLQVSVESTKGLKNKSMSGRVNAFNFLKEIE